MAPSVLRVALDWTPNTIHSGLFVAQAKGFYTKLGLSVELLPPDAQYTKTPAKRLEAGEVDLAICPSESCIAYNESGKLKLQAIYAILQKDASAIVSTKLESMRELAGRKYGSYNARYEDAIVQAMVTKDGGEGSTVEIERSEGKLSMFEAVKSGRVDATWIFLPWEGVEAEMDGVQTKHFTLENFEIPYGYSPVIARNAGVGPTQETLAAFVQATRQGYEYALKNPDEAAEVLREHCVPPRSEEFLRMSQASINQYYGDGHGKLGSMDGSKWSAWINWLKEQGLILEPNGVTEENIYTNLFAE